MRPILFSTESHFQHPSKLLQSKRLLNYAAGRPRRRTSRLTVPVLVPTPGLAPTTLIGSGPWHALDTPFVSVFYIVSGDTAYRTDVPIGTVGVATNPFPAGTIQAMVTIASNLKYAVFLRPAPAVLLSSIPT